MMPKLYAFDEDNFSVVLFNRSIQECEECKKVQEMCWANEGIKFVIDNRPENRM